MSIDIAAILTYVQHGCDIPLGNASGDRGTQPELDANQIMFNGVGDASHETFSVSRVRGKSWEGGQLGHDFCKTARKPYDLAVTACLCYLSSVAGTFDVSSDGHGQDFVDGLRAAREALPEKANLLDIPLGVMANDRWTGPWINDRNSGYSVNFCVNGKAYVTYKKTGETYCFATHGECARFLEAHKVAKFRSGGVSSFGSYGKEEPDIWNAFGSFDQKRHQRIAKAQAKVLKTLFPVDPAHQEQPPAYVRPGDLPRPENDGSFCYSLGELLQKISA